MQAQNRAAKWPWSGAVALALALLLSVGLLRGASLQGFLNTWHLTRSAGVVAYLLLFASTALGLLQSLGMLKGVTGPIANLDLHEHLSLWSIYATVFHVVILLYNHYLTFTWLDLTIPFFSGYERVMMAFGILSFYVILVVTVTTYLRSRLTPQRWRAIHLVSLAGFLMALIHGVMMGTDTGNPFMGFLYRFTGLSVGLLAAYRLFKGVRAKHAHPAGRG